MLTAFQDFLYNCALSFDLPVLDWIQANLTNDFLDNLMSHVTHLGSAGSLIAIAVVAALHVWKRNTLLSILCGVISYMLLVQLVF